jgi:hypothetical protein
VTLNLTNNIENSVSSSQEEKKLEDGTSVLLGFMRDTLGLPDRLAKGTETLSVEQRQADMNARISNLGATIGVAPQVGHKGGSRDGLMAELEQMQT